MTSFDHEIGLLAESIAFLLEQWTGDVRQIPMCQCISRGDPEWAKISAAPFGLQNLTEIADTNLLPVKTQSHAASVICESCIGLNGWTTAAIPVATMPGTIPPTRCRLGALIKQCSNVRCGAWFREVGCGRVADAVGVSVGRSGSAGSRPSPASEPRQSTPHPGRVLDGHWSPGLRHRGWEPTAINRRPRSDLVKFKRSTYASVNYRLSAIPGLPDQVWLYDRDLRKLAPPRTVWAPRRTCTQQTHEATRCGVGANLRALIDGKLRDHRRDVARPVLAFDRQRSSSSFSALRGATSRYEASTSSLTSAQSTFAAVKSSPSHP